MSFVFYDTETTGVVTNFDQILQFAAIRTDADLNETDRIEVRSRLQLHVIPHPSALRVTGITINQANDPGHPSHYEMIREIQAKLRGWSPAVFVGYNSLNFDEHLLRQALFQTLHPPYLTNTNGNCRGDAMTLVQAASVFAPDCLCIPNDSEGERVFKLDQVAPLNGFAHDQAHDAIADVEATIHLARCVRMKAPDCWSRFVRFAKKATVAEFVQDEDGFVLTEFYFNRPYHYVVGCFGFDPAQNNVALCLNLETDLDELSTLSEAELLSFARQSPKPIRRVRTNAAPLVAAVDEMPVFALGGLSLAEVSSRARRLKADESLKARLTAAFVESQAEREVSAYVEDQIYNGFVGEDDERRMAAFHLADWTDRVDIVEAFADSRLRYFGRRIIHSHRPELLRADHRLEIDELICGRLLAETVPKEKWVSLGAALSATDELLETSNGSERELLSEYRAYLLGRIERLSPQ